MFVKPADGRKVRDPVTKRHIPDEGKEVPETSYWLRRIAAGDVQIASSEVSVLQAQMIPDSDMDTPETETFEEVEP